ncbi:DUF4376 domain-containing protein [Methylobacterium sp. M6A4_1b]
MQERGLLATHDDKQTIPASAYGEGVYVVSVVSVASLQGLDRIGPAPEEHEIDNRPYKEPEPDLAAYAAARRYAVETCGIEVAGERVATDRQSQALINGAFNLAQVDTSVVVKFKTAAGFVDLDSAAIQIISTAVGRHVQACFSKEATVAGGIADGTIKSLADIDTAFAALT